MPQGKAGALCFIVTTCDEYEGLDGYSRAQVVRKWNQCKD